MNRRLQGGCQVPIGAYAELKDGQVYLRGLVGDPDGARVSSRRSQRPCKCSGNAWY